jgi:hypothetical protein
MTTKVKIEITQQHMPVVVVVEVLRSDGSISHMVTLSSIGVYVEEYVHSGQTLRVREMTTQEQHDEPMVWNAQTGRYEP